jgi:predicted glycosyltransferase
MAMVDWVLRAYESDKSLPLAALIVLGPFMPHEARDDFIERSKSLDRVKIITFDSRLEVLMANSACVVSMAGYNTFCEILSYDKRALVLPRTEPRKEQLIRALRAEEMGLLKVLIPEGGLDTKIMAQALHDLPHQDKPSTQLKPGMLGGLESIGSIAQRILGNGIDAEVRQYADL